MPFTISHAVLAPPISKLTGHKLPISAIAIGSMVPDLFRLFTSDKVNSTHLWSSWLYPNLFIGLAFYLLWYFIFRPACFRFVGINKPIVLHSFKETLSFISCVIVALIVGTSTHLIWDGLTHLDYRTFAFHGFLKQQMSLFNHSYPMHRILQIATSIIALPILAWMAQKYYSRYQQKSAVTYKVKTYALCLLILSFLIGCYGYIDFAQSLGNNPWQGDLYEYVGRSINHFFSHLLFSFGLGCLIFRILNHFKYFD